MKDKKDKIKKIKEAIAQLRPFFVADGGDIRFVEITGNVAKVKLYGACKTCSMSHMTIKSGIEDAIKKVVPEIVAVEAIDSE
ncbi:MAG: NifU family protein [Bacteroidetes bacterium]|nr:NifU family protein [Bacteroidota bacterium]MBV6460305.1 Fe/S biogenesis protein NfuA [Flavobacteriales bacterium]WKZ74673.1 MAG: NifU family protein [Vicingaceae bacterium]MCL4815829.1 NifU family protein [Flavobacteriales bacterium]NOG94980.1 NifU family protein [Bacteroidota bacterium]